MFKNEQRGKKVINQLNQWTNASTFYHRFHFNTSNCYFLTIEKIEKVKNFGVFCQALIKRLQRIASMIFNQFC